MNTLNYLHLDEKRVADVVTALHLLLADFQIHYTNLRGFHWDIKGHGFFVLHSKFEDLYNDTAEKIDEIAERILTLGSVPSNKFSDYLKVARIKEISGVTCGSEAVEHILSTYGHLIGEERKVLDLAAEAGDEVTVSLMYNPQNEKMRVPETKGLKNPQIPKTKRLLFIQTHKRQRKPKQPVSLPFVLYIQFKSNIIFTANQTDSLINVILVNMDITKV